MKHLLKITLTTILLSSLSACDNKDSTKIISNIKANTAVITIGNKAAYHMPVQVCNKPRTDTFKGQSITHYSIVAQSNKNKVKATLLINGVKGKKEDIANYKLELNDNGERKTFLGKAPYKIFDGSIFHYIGRANTIEESHPIEITINCKG